ncbi:MAG: hypothetical protein J6125_01320 [Clostridia bacterium]|nr:hypothetical protein [Clostridia bacterium]
MSRIDEYNRPYLTNPEGDLRGMDALRRDAYAAEVQRDVAELPQARVAEVGARPVEYPEEREPKLVLRSARAASAPVSVTAAAAGTPLGLTLSAVATTTAAVTLIVVFVVLAQTASLVTVSLFMADETTFVFEVVATLPDDGYCVARLQGENYLSEQRVDGAPFLLFYDLLPDTEYTLTVTDPTSGEEYYSGSYRTPLEATHIASLEAFYEARDDADPSVFLYLFVDPEVEAPFVTVALIDRQRDTLFVTDDPLSEQMDYRVSVPGPGDYYAYVRINQQIVAFAHIPPPPEPVEPTFSASLFFADDVSLVYSVSADLSADSRYTAYLTGDDFAGAEQIIDGAPFLIFRDLTPDTTYRLTVVDPVGGVTLCDAESRTAAEGEHTVFLSVLYEDTADLPSTVLLYPYYREEQGQEPDATPMTVCLLDRYGVTLLSEDFALEGQQEPFRVSVSAPDDYYAFLRIDGEVVAFAHLTPDTEPEPDYTASLFYVDEGSAVFSLSPDLMAGDGYIAYLTDGEDDTREQILDGLPFVEFTDLMPDVAYELTVVDPTDGSVLCRASCLLPLEVDRTIGLEAFYDVERYGVPTVIVYPYLRGDVDASYMTLNLVDSNGATLYNEDVPLLADQSDHPVTVSGPDDYFAWIEVEGEIVAFVHLMPEEEPIDPQTSLSAQLFYADDMTAVFSVAGDLPDDGGVYVARLTDGADDTREQAFDGAPFVFFSDLILDTQYLFTVVETTSGETICSAYGSTTQETSRIFGVEASYEDTADTDGPTVYLSPYCEDPEDLEETIMTVVLTDRGGNTLLAQDVDVVEPDYIEVPVDGPGDFYVTLYYRGDVVSFVYIPASDDPTGGGGTSGSGG